MVEVRSVSEGAGVEDGGAGVEDGWRRRRGWGRRRRGSLSTYVHTCHHRWTLSIIPLLQFANTLLPIVLL